jgi:hypothetical protein
MPPKWDGRAAERIVDVLLAQRGPLEIARPAAPTARIGAVR